MAWWTVGAFGSSRPRELPRGTSRTEQSIYRIRERTGMTGVAVALVDFEVAWGTNRQEKKEQNKHGLFFWKQRLNARNDKDENRKTRILKNNHKKKEEKKEMEGEVTQKIGRVHNAGFDLEYLVSGKYALLWTLLTSMLFLNSFVQWMVEKHADTMLIRMQPFAKPLISVLAIIVLLLFVATVCFSLMAPYDRAHATGSQHQYPRRVAGGVFHDSGDQESDEDVSPVRTRRRKRPAFYRPQRGYDIASVFYGMTYLGAFVVVGSFFQAVLDREVFVLIDEYFHDSLTKFCVLGGIYLLATTVMIYCLKQLRHSASVARGVTENFF